MKLTAFLLLVTLLQLNATGHTQSITVDTEHSSLKAIFRTITKQTGYAVFYSNRALSETKPVSVSVTNMPLKKFLSILFADQPLGYEVRDDIETIILSRKQEVKHPEVVSRPVVDMEIPLKRITGVVVDENGTPIKGASILVSKKEQKGTVTDNEGKFTLEVAEGDMLIISSIGFKTQSIVIAKQSTLHVILETSVNKMNEVVVIGYGTQLRKDLTGSVGSIKGEDIQKSTAVSFTQSMQGRLAGLQVSSSSGEPGSSVNVNIRGANSFTSGVQPLYVIDGVQIDVNTNEVATSDYENTSVMDPLSGINPSDIASIEVLKDASATAIYGSRGANGVIIVTTKSGNRNFSSLELNAYSGLSTPAKKIPMLGAKDYATYRYAITPTDPLWGMDTDGDGVLDAPRDYSDSVSHNWQDVMLRPALSQNYNVDYRGGNNKTSFSSSLGYLNQQGLIRKNSYQRFNANLKLGYNATKNFKIISQLNASYMENTGSVTNSGSGPRNYNGAIANILLYKPIGAPNAGEIEDDPDNSGLGSPLDFANYSQKKTPTLRVIANITGDYKIGKDVDINTNFGGVIVSSKDKEWYPSTTSWGYAVDGLAILGNNNTSNWFNTTTATFHHVYNKMHNVTVMAGFEANTYIYESFSMRTSGFDIQSVNGVDNISTGKVQLVPPTTNKYKYNRLSQFGRVNYIYKDKYLFTATLRNDGSSKFGEGNKYALFPSAALAWRASKEAFLKNSTVISDFKIRTSFGVTGNDRISPYQSLAGSENVYYPSPGGAALGVAPSILANPDLKWETTYQYDGGLDISLFKDRVSLTADAYLKQTKNLLLNADIPGQSGYYKQWQNIGRVDNHGFEFTLNTINIQTKNFTWSTNFNISFNRNEVKSIGNVPYLPVSLTGGLILNQGRIIPGYPIGIVYGYVFDGIYQTSDFVTGDDGTTSLKSGVVAMGSRTAKPGDFKYKDLNG
ncbi:MAG: SusC/RagA family TonB-linked outer membrane protein, partial [Niabella sp.]